MLSASPLSPRPATLNPHNFVLMRDIKKLPTDKIFTIFRSTTTPFSNSIFSSLEPAPVQNYQSELNKIVAMQNNSTSQPMETSDISSPPYDSLYHFYRANSTQNDLLTAAAAEVLNPPSPKESKLGIVFSRPNYGDVTTSRHDVESPKNVVNNFVVTPIET